MPTSTHTRQRRIRITEAGDAIARRDTFVAGDGSLSGGFERLPRTDTGYLRSGPLSDYRAAQDQLGAELYVVRSYGTPIAWGTASGPLTVPAVRYSVTTSRHQGIARRASA